MALVLNERAKRCPSNSPGDTAPSPPPLPKYEAPRVRDGAEGKDDRCPRLRENQRQTLTAGVRNPNPARAGGLGTSYLQGAPARMPAPVQPRMQPEGCNGTEGASTPPLSSRSPNDRGRKFMSSDSVAFHWVNLTPLRRRPFLGSPSPPAPPQSCFHLHLDARKPGLGHLRRCVRQEPDLAPRTSRSGPAAAGAQLTSPGRVSSLAPYWAVRLRLRLPGARRIQAAGDTLLPGLCCIPPAWEIQPESARHGRVRVCVCESVCV